MNEQQLQKQIDAINGKLDLILEEIALQQRRRREADDFKDDAMRVAKDLYQWALIELEGVHGQVDAASVADLGKKVLRNIGTIGAVIEQLESLRDFLRDASPLARSSFLAFMNSLDELDRKGYFGFAREVGRLVDNIVTTFSPEEVRKLGDSIVSILTTIKNLTQPEMLQAINNAVVFYKKLEFNVTGDVSLFSLLRELNTPEAKKGLSFVLHFLKAVPTTNGVSHA
jgi:uncharacterized protein YjgD (DUF1641 family)